MKQVSTEDVPRRGRKLITDCLWVGETNLGRSSKHSHSQYLRLVDKLPGIRSLFRLGAFTDAKHYLYLFCYFLQPTPANIQSMLLYAIKVYGPDAKLRAKLRVAQPEQMPSVAIYHPEAHGLFESFADYRKWYESRSAKYKLDPESTIGLLLMRPK
jgi:cobalamin biosynthesis Mg chelatase CobN